MVAPNGYLRRRAGTSTWHSKNATTNVRRPSVTSPEPQADQLDDDEVLTPATPGAQALPSADPDPDDAQDE
jgi:hypothetical protein